MTDNPHFATVGSWGDAEDMLTFRPRRPRQTAGFRLESLSIYIRDHKHRDIAVGRRSLEAHYGGFSVTQERKGEAEARRWALNVSFGLGAYPVRLAGHEGRAREVGPEVPPDDIDGRSPAIVVWHDGDMFYMVASGELPARVLIDIAGSMYWPQDGSRGAVVGDAAH